MPVKFVILGDPGVGKTSMLKKLSTVSRSGDGRMSCRCAAFRQNESIDLEFDGKDGRKMFVEIIDTAGQERYRSLTGSFFRGVQGCFLVFNIRQKDSFTNILNWHSDLKKYTDNASTILIGLSTGRRASRDTRVVTSERAFKMAEFLHTDFFETTLDDDEMIVWIVRQMVEKLLRKMDFGRVRLTSIIPSDRESKTLCKKSRHFYVCC